ncbi:diaminopimelate epimerase [Chloroflexota bacterium]
MKFIKMQGTGNDFILLETNNSKRDWSKLAVTMCNRHFGIGADGLLLLLPSKVADLRMRLFNPDGSEAETCGNGLRCLVKYFTKRVPSDPISEISVETMAGIVKAKAHKNDELDNIEISMSKPKLEARDIPVTIEPSNGNIVYIKSMINYSITADGEELNLNLVSMGNPHAVLFSQIPVSEFPLSRLGPKVEIHGIFPKHVNFEVARVLTRSEIEARVWEKGVGETLACGSGACAITVAAHLHGYVDNNVNIKLPGGMLGVIWDSIGEVFLNGPAETVFTGEWPD